MSELSQHVLPNDTDVCLLDCLAAFNKLTDKEKLYTHYLSQASWAGGLIVLLQTSPESPGIYLLLQKMFRSYSMEEMKNKALACNLTDDEFQALTVYAAAFYANMGNYKSFGDIKFIPNLPKEKFEAVVMTCGTNTGQPETMALWKSIGDAMYDLTERHRELALGKKGITTYFSSNCEIDDAKAAQEYLNAKEISAYNTRLFKTLNPTTQDISYEVRLASVQTQNGELPGYRDESILKTEKFKSSELSQDVIFRVTRGDYSRLLLQVAINLEKAKEFAANEKEVKMLTEYIKSFTTGSIPAHKDGSRLWIQNKGPIVEMYIGFIESYRDPFGVRGEFEGFVAVVNKEMSSKFSKLVESAPHLLPLLPWPAAYEKDKFLCPDFTSLDVLTYAGSGIPAGINIPNYNDIRQNEGFKNVSLGNVLSAGYKDKKITFLEESDKVLYNELKISAFEVQVGLHELLGHGSGKLFIKDEKGKLNFDADAVTHTETHKKIDMYYSHTENWDSKFSVIASTYEECRAECVGLYLCLSADVLKIFDHLGNQADDIIYINWLNMVRAGLLALEFYTPKTMTWRQAHMQARFVILRVLLEAGKGLITIRRLIGEDGNPDLCISLDRSKIISVGKPAIGNFLRKLQVYKSTGDVEAGSAMYNHYSDVNDVEEPHFLTLREIVLDRKQPRKMFVQHNTVIKGKEVTLKTYEATTAGLIQSFIDRFSSIEFDCILQELWDKDREHFKL